MLKCRWCGYTGPEEDFDLSPDNTGFWCNDCEGFTFFNQEDQANQRFCLLLEQKFKPAATNSKIQPSPLPHPRLRKQLSPLRYPGGKSRLIDYLYQKLSSEKLDTFVEVFAGGASFGLSLLDAGVIQHLVLNDIDPGVYALWDTILNNSHDLIARLSSSLPTHKDLKYAKELDTSEAPTALRAWSFLLVNRLSYSGICFANPLGGKNGTQEALLARWNPDKLISRVNQIHSMRDCIELSCKDCCQLIEESAWWKPRTTIFADPPYFKMGPRLYKHSFTVDDHIRLAETLETLYRCFPSSDILVTYDDHQFIRSLYPLAHQEVMPRVYSI